jgi:flap endonuclease-1
MGIPYLDAIGEADPQCAELVKSGSADYVLSEDMDLLTFGTPYLIRGLTKNKPIIYNLNKLLSELKLTQLQFVDLCILFGCDYTPRIKKVGVVRAFKLIKKYKNIENIIKNEKTIDIPSDYNYLEARDYFVNAKVIANPIIERSSPNIIELTELLLSEYEYTVSNIDELLELLTGIKKPIKNLMIAD